MPGSLNLERAMMRSCLERLWRPKGPAMTPDPDTGTPTVNKQDALHHV